jgi:TRAP-type C4-dicarboxylate transport system substrate-binding protein
MSFSRRTLLKASAASAVLSGVGAPVVVRAQAAEFTYKYANNLPDSHPMNARAKEMAAAIKAETNGRFDLQIFPNNQLGSDTDMLSQVRSGGVELFTLSGLILSTLVKAASINGIGFAFPDYDTVWKAMDGDLGGYVRGEIGKAGLVVMDKIWDNGFRQTTQSTKPINGPDDFKALQDPAVPGRFDLMFRRAFDAAPRSTGSILARSIPRCRPRRGRPGKSAGDHLRRHKLYEVQKYAR